MKRQIQQTTISERAVLGGRQITLRFGTRETPEVPATLLLPLAAADPAPAALLIHGYSSRKEHMAENVGQVLLSHGIASLSIDLPLHGTRRSETASAGAAGPLELLRHWRTADREVRLAAHFLRARAEVARERVGVVGYSLGSFLAVSLAAADPAIRAVVVAAGGDLPSGIPFGTLARTVVDPLRAVRALAGRPLLVIHGRRDRTVLPDQAQRLFDAAAEPREIRWYDAGHYLPAAAIDDAAAWLAQRLAAA